VPIALLARRVETSRVAVVVDNAEERLVLPGERLETGQPIVISVVLNPFSLEFGLGRGISAVCEP
jgi:hypothetical protein